MSVSEQIRTPVVAYAARLTAEELYRLHRQRVYRLCLRLGGANVAWAEDRTHDVFVKLLRWLPEMTANDDVGGWIYRVTVNTCLTHLRREGSVWQRVRMAVCSGEPTASTETPEGQLETNQEIAAGLRLLQRLPAKERVVLCMRHLDGLPQHRIAQTLSLSESYVSKLLKRAQNRLQGTCDG